MHGGSTRYLPQVALATFCVAGLPALVVSAGQGIVRVPAGVAILLAMALSVVFSRIGSAIWMRRPGSRDIVFGDLMVWGWLRRMRAERRLSEARDLLGDGELSAGRRAELLESLAAALEARDPYTSGHSSRVARHAEAIAREMGLGREQVAKVRTAAAVHDVGKIRTPREILNKPDRLTDPEREVMQAHARDGAEMVAGLDDDEITAMVEFHHERLDGSGYPDGRRDSDIPLGARIIAVADTFDAMTSSRPYCSAQRHKRALDVLAADAPERLDPRVVAAFRHHYSGDRAVPVSAFIAAVPQRLGAWLAGLFQGEAALPLGQGLSALGAAALLGGSMIGSPVSLSGGSAVSASSGPAQSVTAPLAAGVPFPSDGTPGAGGGDAAPGGDGGGSGGDGPGGRRRQGSNHDGGTPDSGPPRSTPGTGQAGDTAGQQTSIPAPQPSQQQPSPPASPPSPPQGWPVRPTVIVRPDGVQVGADVRLPQSAPVQLPDVSAGVGAGAPRGQLPQVAVEVGLGGG